MIKERDLSSIVIAIRPKTRIYFENLDSLRFLAFLAVFVSHAALFLGYENDSSVYQFVKDKLLVNGDLGVTFFFVLSGFLITFLLLKEEELNNSISLKNFYLRRILRIWPVYIAVVLIGYLLIPLFLNLLEVSSLPFNAVAPSSSWYWHSFFISNFAMAKGIFSSVPTDILWSVGIEEQFYFLWPMVVIFLPRKYLIKFLTIVILSAFLLRSYFAYEPDFIAYSTLSAMSDLSVGCLLAVFAFSKKGQFNGYVLSRWFISIVYAATLILLMSRKYLIEYLSSSEAIFRLFVPTIYLFISILFALIILEQNYSNRSLFKAGRIPFLGKLGRISYGLYAYHPAVFAFILGTLSYLGFSTTYNSPLKFVAISALVLVGTICFSTLSYRYYEKWFLSKKPSSVSSSDSFSM